MADLTLVEISEAMQKNIACLRDLYTIMEADEGTTQDLRVKKPPIPNDPTVTDMCTKPQKPCKYEEAFDAALKNLKICQEQILKLMGVDEIPFPEPTGPTPLREAEAKE